MKHIVSFSGGRTSAYLVYLMEQKRKTEGWDVEYVFMDTGAEHPKTYEFIRSVVSLFKISLTCLRGNFEQDVGTGHTAEVISIDEIGLDLKNGAFAQMMRKYGIPTVKSAWCTTRMKEEVNTKYCESQGYENIQNWIGYRADEPARYFGKSAWQELQKHRFHESELHEIFKEAISGSDLMNRRLVGSTRQKILLRAEALKKSGLRYLCEIDDAEKYDVNRFWSKQPVDLGIGDHLGNCVFCLKKSINKVALAMRDEPELLQQWLEAIENGSGRLNEGNEIPKGVMYRGKNSNSTIQELFKDMTRDELLSTIRSMKDTSVYSESCEAFGQLDLLGEAA